MGLRRSYFISGLQGSVKHLQHLLLRNMSTLQFITTVWVLLSISKQRDVFVARKECVPTQLVPWVW